VGGSVELDLAVAYDDVRPQDRYLLCTDGLYTVVAEDDLARALSLDDPRRACAELETLALGTAAADNITGVVVWVGEAEPASPNGAAHGG
jgi:serine/threonine protein phosphatase PrpC